MTSLLGKSDYTLHSTRYLSGPRRTWSCQDTRHRGTFLKAKTARCCEKGIKIWQTQGNVPRSAWGIFLTFALSLVLYIQVRVSFALRLQQRALVLVGLPVGAADGSLPGDVGAVWCANAARLTPPVHLAPLSGAAVNIVAGFYNSEDCVMSCEGAFSSPRVTILGRATALNFRLGSPPALIKRNNCAL